MRVKNGDQGQKQLILDYLGGSPNRRITNLIAIGNMGIGSLSSRIAELRAAGHDIKDEVKHDHYGAPYKSYFLATKETKAT